MSELILAHQVHTLDNEILFPAGTVLEAGSLEGLISSKRNAVPQTYSLLRYGSVIEDMLGFLRDDPYRTIFSEQDIASVLRSMDDIRIVLPALHSLEYFKRNDSYSYRHILMVFALSTLLAGDLIPEHPDLVRLAATGPTHDIGKTCTPLHILKKTTPLTREEKKILDSHSIAGYVLLSYYLGDAQGLAPIVARDHHERRDGSGQPRGVPLEDAMVEIMVVCDVYDALISPRPYRPIPYDNRTALEEIIMMAERNEVGWDTVKALVARNRKSRTHFKELPISSEKRGKPPLGNVHGILEDEEGV
jgi:HD-GYP domain-containing protein (c-di-GMP phosphodiesterase class II)